MQTPITADVEPLPERHLAAQRGATSPKVLWGTIGALAVVVAALGGTMLYQHSSDHGSTPNATAPAQPLYGPEDGGRPSAALTAPTRAPDNAGTVSRAAPPAPARAPVCATCGRVESVRTVQHAAPPTGVGAVAGGVLGGVLGNQIGHGGGRTAATVIGAVGGGYAGHTIEKRTRTETRYQVSVRMDDGRLRTVETQTAPPIGKPVVVEGRVLRPADGRI